MQVIVDVDDISQMLEEISNPWEVRDAVISYLAEECMDLDLYLMGRGQPQDEMVFYRDLYEDIVDDEEDDFDDDWNY